MEEEKKYNEISAKDYEEKSLYDSDTIKMMVDNANNGVMDVKKSLENIQKIKQKAQK